jgi:hypothetical protein
MTVKMRPLGISGLQVGSLALGANVFGWSVVQIIDAIAAGEDWSAHGVLVL